MSPSRVAPICNPSGGNRVVEWWDLVDGWGVAVPSLACPFQVRGLSHMIRAKARVNWPPKVEGTASGWLHRAAITSRP